VHFNWFQVFFPHKFLKFPANILDCRISGRYLPSAQQFHENSARWELEVPEMEQYNNFRLTLVTGWYFPLQIRPLWSIYTVLNASPTTERTSGSCIS
jgi:hypothetical protein